MDLRKYGKPPKKIISAEKALGIAKKTKMKKPKKSKKDKPKKPRKGKPKSILSKTLKRATTTEQSIRNDTQQQFLQNLHGRLNNNDGRTNGIWNSYKRNITAQSFGGTPYEMYRLQEESTILRDMLERATNDGRRRPPQVSTTETQTDTQRPRYQPTTPTTTPPPMQSPQARRASSNLGFGQTIQATRQIAKPATFTGGSGVSGVMTSYVPEKIEGVKPREGIEYDFDDSHPFFDGNVSPTQSDLWSDLSEGEQREEEKYDATNARLRRLGDTTGNMPYLPRDIRDWEYDPKTEPSGAYGGYDSSDDDEEEYKDPNPSDNSSDDTDSNDINFDSLQGDSSNQFKDADEGY
jgi:hypothetical protein